METLVNSNCDFSALGPGRVFQASGLPLCLYVDYHSFFFTHTPEAHTQLAAALAFYDVSLRFAPTPQCTRGSVLGQFSQSTFNATNCASAVLSIVRTDPRT